MRELKVKPIQNGTVIDHIPGGAAMHVFNIITSSEDIDSTISILMRVPSKAAGKKDIVKLENKEMKARELNRIALIAPNATINIIKNGEVKKKFQVELPDVVRGIVKCANPGCISNKNEPIDPEFKVLSKDPLRLRCMYCERELDDVKKYIV